MVYPRFVLAALVVITINGIIGCGSRTSTSQVLSDGTTSTIPSTTTTTTSTGANLPTNLFDNSTASDAAPATSTLYPGTAPASANLCSSSDSYFFGAGSNIGSFSPTSSTSVGGNCAGAQLDPNGVLSSGVQTMSDLFACYQTVLQNRPATNDPATVAAALQVGGMAITRCVRMYVQAAQAYGNQNGGWPDYQNQVYGAGDNLLVIVIKALAPHY